MKTTLIAAMSENGVIGNHNQLPWHLPEELKYFRAKTLAKPVIMGRKTFESMGSKPLPKRLNIILTEQPDFSVPGCTVVHSVEKALDVLNNEPEVMIIGGAKIYALFLPLATHLYLTVVEGEYQGDTFFPTVQWAEWTMVSAEKHTGFTTKVFEKHAV